MPNEKYLKTYEYIHDICLLHEEICNNGEADKKWADDFANVYFAITHKENYNPEEKKEFMDGWYAYWQNIIELCREA